MFKLLAYCSNFYFEYAYGQQGVDQLCVFLCPVACWTDSCSAASFRWEESGDLVGFLMLSMRG